MIKKKYVVACLVSGHLATNQLTTKLSPLATKHKQKDELE